MNAEKFDAVAYGSPQERDRNQHARGALIKPEEVDQLLTFVQRQLAGRICDLRILVQEEGLVLQGRAYSYYANT